MKQRILVLTDNVFLFKRFKSLLSELNLDENQFDFACTSSRTESLNKQLKKIDINVETKNLISIYNLIFSLHCKRRFPSELVNGVKCINIHPGFNPYNRGWYPQVFSIINNLPVGATIHEMDEEIDHGKIIVQKQVSINNWDTSGDVYNRILELEMELLKNNLINILNNGYSRYNPESDGNYNSAKEFENLKEINLDEVSTAKEFINRLRALTHENFKNAFFKDPINGEKIFIRLQLEKECTGH